MLYDASSIQKALRSLKADAVHHLNNQSVLDLTLYELGNIIWKETNTPDEAITRATALEKIANIMQIHRIKTEDLTPITQNSAKHNLTFYDSAYLTIAQKQNTTLVTEDQQILKAAETAGHPATQLEKILKH